MLILPDRNISRTKLLTPVPVHEWRDPSQAQFKDQFGNPGVQTRFRLRAFLHDGHVAWCGWFDDRADFDAFLFAAVTGSLFYERELWRLPTPAWHPDFGEDLWYDFATVTFLTSPTGSNQTYTSTSDWGNPNSIELIAGGGSGGVSLGSGTRVGIGAGGAEYGKTTNFSFASPGITTATYRIAAGGVAVSGAAAGNVGGDSWWNGTTQAGATLGAIGGAAGKTSTVATNTAAAGGTGGVGTTHFAGGASGSSGSSTAGQAATGGGGAGGKTAAGNAGGAINANNDISAGGSADGGGGGAGGTTNTTVGNPGGNGTEWDASHGSGGGGAAAGNNTAGATGGAGGNYGGGGGAVGCKTATGTSGAGIAGIVVVTYTPVLPKGIPFFTSRRIFISRRK